MCKVFSNKDHNCFESLSTCSSIFMYNTRMASNVIIDFSVSTGSQNVNYAIKGP